MPRIVPAVDSPASDTPRRLRSVGTWEAELDVGDGGPDASRALVRTMLAAAQSGLAGLVGFDRLSVSVERLDPLGVVLDADDALDARLLPGGEVALADGDRLIVGAIADGDLTVHRDGRPVTIPGAVELQVTLLRDDSDGGRPATTTDAGTTLTLHADAWLDDWSADPPPNPFGPENRRRLAEALRAWEQRLGAPFNAFASDQYPTAVDRYGFTREGFAEQPPPPEQLARGVTTHLERAVHADGAWNVGQAALGLVRLDDIKEPDRKAWSARLADLGPQLERWAHDVERTADPYWLAVRRRGLRIISEL